MSEGLNRVLLLGNLGADPELRHTQGGTGVLSMRVATTETYLDKDKVRRERTEWHTVVVFGRRGEGLAKFLSKGMGVFVEGSIRSSEYEDRDKIKRYKTEIIASNVIVTRGDRQGGQQQTQHRETHANDHGQSRGGYGSPRQQSAPQQAPAADPPPDDFGYDSGDDIPF